MSYEKPSFDPDEVTSLIDGEPEPLPAEKAPVLEEPKAVEQVTEASYPKYQLSKFVDKRRDYQIVIRTNDANELIAAMKKIKPLIEGIEKREATIAKANPPQPAQAQATQAMDGLRRICKSHGVDMVYGQSKKINPRTGQPFEYWSHKSDQGAMCFGKGYEDRN